MGFKNWVKNIQAAGYNGARTVFNDATRNSTTLLTLLCTKQQCKIVGCQKYTLRSLEVNFPLSEIYMLRCQLDKCHLTVK